MSRAYNIVASATGMQTERIERGTYRLFVNKDIGERRLNVLLLYTHTHTHTHIINISICVKQ